MAACLALLEALASVLELSPCQPPVAWDLGMAACIAAGSAAEPSPCQPLPAWALGEAALALLEAPTGSLLGAAPAGACTQAEDLARSTVSPPPAAPVEAGGAPGTAVAPGGASPAGAPAKRSGAGGGAGALDEDTAKAAASSCSSAPTGAWEMDLALTGGGTGVPIAACLPAAEDFGVGAACTPLGTPATFAGGEARAAPALAGGAGGGPGGGGTFALSECSRAAAAAGEAFALREASLAAAGGAFALRAAAAA